MCAAAGRLTPPPAPSMLPNELFGISNARKIACPYCQKRGRPAARASHRKPSSFSPDRPLLTDGGGRIAPLAIAYETRGTLNAARSNAILLCHALTGDQYAAGVHPVTGKPGWWEAMVGTRQAFRHQSLFPDLLECRRRLHGHDRPGVDQSDDRQALWRRLPGRHHPRHGARAGDAHRSSRHRHAVLRRRRLDGRHAGAAMGGELSGTASSRRCRSPPPRNIQRRTSPSTKSAGRR